MTARALEASGATRRGVAVADDAQARRERTESLFSEEQPSPGIGVEHLGRGEGCEVSAVNTTDDQNPAVGEQHWCMSSTLLDHTFSRGPYAGRRVDHLSPGNRDILALMLHKIAGDQHSTIRKQLYCLSQERLRGAYRRPGVREQVIYLSRILESAHHQHSAVSERHRCVLSASLNHAAGRGPGASIVS